MSDSRSSGMGLAGVLLVIFITLKVLQVQPVAGWSWLWVLSPFWIPACVAMLLVFVFAVFSLVSGCIAAVGEWFVRRKKMGDMMDD